MLLYEHTLWVLLGAIILDAVIGDPNWLWRFLPHPVSLIGSVISAMDKGANKPAFSAKQRKQNGIAALLLLVFAALTIGILLEEAFRALPYGEIGIAVIGMTLIAQKSLYQHVARVRDALQNGGLTEGRKAVSMIVGRDPDYLDEAGVSRATIESCAENFSDGVVAPIFWFAVLGLPGILMYKAVNTADSMIGHKNEKYGAFGWASARFDDLINLPASRLSGLLICCASLILRKDAKAAFSTMLREADDHRSPNAGWPEAAVAGALGVALAGPRQYAEYKVEDPFMNPTGRKEATAQDINGTLKLMAVSCCVLAGDLLVLAVL